MGSPNSIAVTLPVRPALNVRLPALQRPNCTVEIEARAVTIERLFMISEREWTFGETLEYSLDALEPTTAAPGILEQTSRRTQLGYRA